jgi:hypothetical protein
MTLTETNKILAIIRENWPNHPWSEHADRVWHMALDDVPYEVVEAALPELFRTQKFAPVPADIRVLLKLPTETDEWGAQLPNGEQAWEEIRRQIKYPGAWGVPTFSHPLIERTMRAFGWNELCGCPADQMNTLRAQVERFHNQFRNDAISALKRGTPMDVAIASWADQRRILGLVPAALPETVDA